MTTQFQSPGFLTDGSGASGLLPTNLIRIWLVDDDDRLRSILAQGLQHFDGIQCAGDFNSPNAVLSALASRPGPDLILLDVQMGEQCGLDAIRPIRSLSRGTRVVMFTTCYDPERRRRAMADGASDFLLKGNLMEDVVARIRQLVLEPPPRVRRRRASGAHCTRSPVKHQRRRSWLEFFGRKPGHPTDGMGSEVKGLERGPQPHIS
jgi:DNA-binding NarL/FixJ family response regulator